MQRGDPIEEGARIAHVSGIEVAKLLQKPSDGRRGSIPGLASASKKAAIDPSGWGSILEASMSPADTPMAKEDKGKVFHHFGLAVTPLGRSIGLGHPSLIVRSTRPQVPDLQNPTEEETSQNSDQASSKLRTPSKKPRRSPEKSRSNTATSKQKVDNTMPSLVTPTRKVSDTDRGAISKRPD